MAAGVPADLQVRAVSPHRGQVGGGFITDEQSAARASFWERAHRVADDRGGLAVGVRCGWMGGLTGSVGPVSASLSVLPAVTRPF